jgi:hypothetical protein
VSSSIASASLVPAPLVGAAAGGVAGGVSGPVPVRESFSSGELGGWFWSLIVYLYLVKEFRIVGFRRHTGPAVSTDATKSGPPRPWGDLPAAGVAARDWTDPPASAREMDPTS